MHAVCETPAFTAAAHAAGMSRLEVEDLTDFLAANPEAGDELAGTGGCRKLRVAGRGKGKSGGYRVVTFYTGPRLPVFLITVFGKGEKSNLSKAECNGLAKMTAILAAEYRKKVVSVSKVSEAKR